MTSISLRLITITVCLGFTVAAANAQTDFEFSADAYGTFATLGKVVVAGKTAVSSLGHCGTVNPPAHSENTILTTDLPPLVTTGVIDTTADGNVLIDGTLQSMATADVHDASALAGLIIADEVKAVSITTHDALGFHTSATGSTFVNLVVAGVPIIVTPEPNTDINLLGFGHVTLNEQVTRVKTTSVSFTVNMIHVFITEENVLGIAVGTEIIVSHASSGLTSGVHGTLDGTAYGTKASIDKSTISGQSALKTMPCLGTNGIVKSNSVAEVEVPLLFSVGEVVDSALGTVNSTSAVGEMTSTVQGVTVATNLVTANVVEADAHASKINGTLSFSDASTFVDLSVAGFPDINDDVPPNTKLSIAGLGTLWLHRVIQTPNSIEIRMIELIVTQPNNFGIEVGTDIQIAVGEASVH